jgi:uncharacterized membrane protein YsdA (DUF1294 family)/cold shock CspA family protein
MTRVDRRRYEGTLESWNDDRGYGFIVLPRGGKTVFAHIRSFEELTARPRVGQVFSFTILTLEDGRLRAQQTRPVEDAVTIPRSRSSAGPIVGALVILIFITEFILLGYFWTLPAWVAFIYLGISVACFLLYAEDKAKARQGRWRVAESSMQVIALIGGWPGAIVAQQVLRHKTRKRGFQFVFWTAVALNMSALALLVIILGRG